MDSSPPPPRRVTRAQRLSNQNDQSAIAVPSNAPQPVAPINQQPIAIAGPSNAPQSVAQNPQQAIPAIPPNQQAVPVIHTIDLQTFVMHSNTRYYHSCDWSNVRQRCLDQRELDEYLANYEHVRAFGHRAYLENIQRSDVLRDRRYFANIEYEEEFPLAPLVIPQGWHNWSKAQHCRIIVRPSAIPEIRVANEIGTFDQAGDADQLAKRVVYSRHTRRPTAEPLLAS